MVQEKISFKAISYLELWWPLRSEELAYLCSVGIKHNTEHFCKFILKLDQLFRRRRLYKKSKRGLCSDSRFAHSESALLFSGITDRYRVLVSMSVRANSQ